MRRLRDGQPRRSETPALAMPDRTRLRRHAGEFAIRENTVGLDVLDRSSHTRCPAVSVPPGHRGSKSTTASAGYDLRGCQLQPLGMGGNGSPGFNVMRRPVGVPKTLHKSYTVVSDAGSSAQDSREPCGGPALLPSATAPSLRVSTHCIRVAYKANHTYFPVFLNITA